MEGERARESDTKLTNWWARANFGGCEADEVEVRYRISPLVTVEESDNWIPSPIFVFLLQSKS